MNYKGQTEVSFRLTEAVKIEPKQGVVDIGIVCDGEFEMQSLARQRGTWTPPYRTLAEVAMPHGGVARLSISHGGMWRKMEIRLPPSHAESYNYINAVYDLFDELRKNEMQPARA